MRLGNRATHVAPLAGRRTAIGKARANTAESKTLCMRGNSNRKSRGLHDVREAVRTKSRTWRPTSSTFTSATIAFEPDSRQEMYDGAESGQLSSFGLPLARVVLSSERRTALLLVH